MSSTDQMQRFIFDNTDIRGEIVSLGDSYAEVLKNNDLPAVVQQLLGEFVAAVSLLSSTLKFDGRLTLQARGDGPLPLIVAECNHHRELRAVARPDDGVDWDSLAASGISDLIGKGMLVIIIEPDKGQRYQGVVPLDADNLAACLEHYFKQSEQLATRLWFAADAVQGCASGLLLQALPQQLNSTAEENQNCWETTTALAATVKTDELLHLPHEELLYRLFNEEAVRLFEPVAIKFQCSCSFDRSAKALVSLGHTEVKLMLADLGTINIDCQFCNQHYHFTDKEVAELFPEKNMH
jgi:molecular chaperone Hsp33